MTDDVLAVVQFMHPGPEHAFDNDGYCKWNPRGQTHARKFMRVNATYRTRKVAHACPVTLWGEWEPPSRRAEADSGDHKNPPRFVHEPLLEDRKDFGVLQNTDPFIFGERFLYTGCKQHTNHEKSETKLRHLARGSVILFGSWHDDQFLLDTVFVADGHIDHNRSNYERVLKGHVPVEYWTVTLGPWYALNTQADGGCSTEGGCTPTNDDPSYRLYFGATLAAPVEGMFSFAPCAPAGERITRFQRPTIALRDFPEVINPKNKQASKTTQPESLEKVRAIWDAVVREVQDAGRSLAVKVEMPNRA